MSNDDELSFSFEGDEHHNGNELDDNDMDDFSDRMKQIEEEAQRLRDMQSEVEKQYQNSTTSSSPIATAISVEEKMMIDTRSIYVGNVDYSATPDQLEEHFRGCGTIERVTILTDKFSGHPKGFAYVQFTDAEGMQNSLALTDSLFLGRQIKVVAKRTNKPGISSTNRPPRGRGRGGRVIVKYIYPGGYRGSRGRPPRRRGSSYYAPY